MNFHGGQCPATESIRRCLLQCIAQDYRPTDGDFPDVGSDRRSVKVVFDVEEIG